MADWRKATEVVDGARPERGVVHRPATASWFDLRRFAATPALDPFVEHLWSVTWDRRGTDSVETAVIPFPSMHLALEWDANGEHRHGHRLPAVLVHGVVTRLFRIELRGAGGVLGVRFRPGGLAAFFGLDVSGLTDRVVPAGEVVDPALASSLEGLLSVPTVEERAGRLLDLLGTRAGAPPERFLRLAALVDEMRDDPDLVRVDQLPERCGWTVRTIQRVFRQDLGAGPKWVLARFRLQEAALALEQSPDRDLAALAHDLGWYDQAHFTNEFRRVMGVTPGEYAAAVRR